MLPASGFQHGFCLHSKTRKLNGHAALSHSPPCSASYEHEWPAWDGGSEKAGNWGICHAGIIRFPVHHWVPTLESTLTTPDEILSSLMHLSHTTLGAMTVVGLQHGHPDVPERGGCSGSVSGGCTAAWPPEFHFTTVGAWWAGAFSAFLACS